MFAFRDGIIDDECTDGGICYNEQGAYAIVMKDSDEKDGLSPNSFTYICRPQGPGRYFLTSAKTPRRPIRILRSHTLSSLYAPQAGLRYDGLFVHNRAVGFFAIGVLIDLDIELSGGHSILPIQDLTIISDSRTKSSLNATIPDRLSVCFATHSLRK